MVVGKIGHHPGVVTERELLSGVDERFDPGAVGLAAWEDPNPERDPPDDAYSRLTDPGKWAIVGVRADAWADALVGLGFAEVVEDVGAPWAEEAGLLITSARRVLPRASGAIPIVIARTEIWGDDPSIRGEGVVLGVGDPEVRLGPFPDCGCDACDSGSQDVLDDVDEQVLGVVTGAFRHLIRPGRRTVGRRPRREQSITVHRDGLRSRNFASSRADIEWVLADPAGWTETSGASWFAPTG